MISTENMDFVHDFIAALDEELRARHPKKGLTKTQKNWIAFCLTGIWVTKTFSWSEFSRQSLGAFKDGASSEMFRNSSIFWEGLLIAATTAMIKKYSITGGYLIIDDTDNPRSKSTSRISKVHKIYDKKTGGYFMGQNIVFLLLVTDKVTIPVGFKFYQPDPKKTEWIKNDKKLRKAGFPKSKRPRKPENDPAFPTKIEIGMHLVEEFKKNFPTLKIQSIIADAAFGASIFFNGIQKIYTRAQVISQLQCIQKVLCDGKMVAVSQAFEGKSQKSSILIRGSESKDVEMAFACLKVQAHEKKRLIIAIRYEEEKDYRYIVASKLNWEATDLASTYSLRWLVEVFIQDWKAHDGWGQFALQRGEKGSFQGMIISLLADQCLLFHPKQVQRIESNRPVCTAGSLRESVKNESILSCFQEILTSDSPMDNFLAMKEKFEHYFKERDSRKHFSGREMPKVKQTRSHKKTSKNLEPAYA